MAEGGGSEGAAAAAVSEMTLEFTPTWIVAAVCFIIVSISLVVERLLHRLGKILKKKGQKPLFEALLKVKGELMILGFISLLLTVFQGLIQKICIPQKLTLHMLPCKLEHAVESGRNSSVKAHNQSAFSTGFLWGGRRLLSENESGAGHCSSKGKFPLLSLEAIHQLHIFIFALAVTHISICILTVLIGGIKTRQWKHWEESVLKENTDDVSRKDTLLHQFQFIRERFKGFGKDSIIISWLHAFFKQFYGSVTKSDYTTMRLGFIMTHFKENSKFDFHKYMIRTLEADFKKVVGISWYHWIFVIIFLLVNINGWHSYFWIAFVPLILLLAVGMKLEHVITQLAHEVMESKNCSIEGDLVVNPSDDHFWFGQPRIILHLIHFILFQNAFEIAFFFWILTTYGFNSCIMGQVRFIIPRLVIGVTVQLHCSYSTLPLYAIVTQMGSNFKKEIFNERVQEGLIDWAQRHKGRKMGNGHSASSHASSHTSSHASKEPSPKIELTKVSRGDEESLIEEEKAGTSESNTA